MSHNVKKRQLKKILSAMFLTVALCLSLSAQLFADTATYDFTGVTNANEGSDGNPLAREHDSDVWLWQFSGHRNDSNTLTDGEYGDISTENGVRWSTDDPGNNDEMVVRFEFFIQQRLSTISDLQILWNGNSDANNVDHTVWFKVFGADDFGEAGAWTQIGGATSIDNGIDQDVIRNITDGFRTYIDPETGLFEFAVAIASTATTLMRTDFVEVQVTYSRADNHVVWDGGSALNFASSNLNWDDDFGPDLTTSVTIDTSAGNIIWDDIDSVFELTTNGAFTGNVVQETDLTVTTLMRVETGGWAMGSNSLSVNDLIIGNGVILKTGGGDLTVAQSLDSQNGEILAGSTGTSTVYFHANDADNTISGNTIADTVIFTTDSAATWTLENDLTIDGDLTVTTGTTFDLATFDLTVTGNVWVEGTLDAGTSQFWIGEKLDATAGAITPGTSKTVFYGTFATEIDLDDEALHDAELNKDLSFSWWNFHWGSRMQLTFSNLSQSQNLTNFPVLVTLDANRIDYDKTQDNGEDLRFLDVDNSTVLSYEIEEWSESGTSYVWVNVPQIDGGSASDYIWLYFDNANAATGEDATGTWDANFVAVWHLQETAGQYLDSTANNNDSTAVNVTGRLSNGQIGSAVPEFEESTDDSVTVTNVIGEVGTTSGTVEAWVRVGTAVDEMIFFGVNEAGAGNGFGGQDELHLGTSNGFARGDYGFFIESTGNDTLARAGTYTAGVFEYVVGTYIANDRGDVYENGVFMGGDINFGAVEDANWGQAFLGQGRAGNLSFDGLLDEVRISNIRRTSDWIAAQYLSMTDDFISYGSEELPSLQAAMLDNVLLNNDLTLNKGPLDIAGFDLTVTGNLDLNASATIDGASANGEVFIGGSWDSTGGDFLEGIGTVFTFGASNGNFTMDGEIFNNFIVGGIGTRTLQDPLQITNDLTVNVGTLDTDTTDLTVVGNIDLNATLDNSDTSGYIFADGNWDSTGGTLNAGSGVIEFTGTTDTTATAGGVEFSNITVQKTDTNDAITFLDTLSMSGDLLVDSGKIETNTDVTLNGNMTIANSATFESEANGATIFFNDDNAIGYWVNAGGTVTWKGQGGDPLFLRSDSPGNQWNFYLLGSRNIENVDVRDSDASGGNLVNPVTSLGANTVNWFPVSGLFIWDSGGGTNDASEGSNWLSDTTPGNFDNALIDSTNDQINWDLNTISDLSLTGAFGGELTQSVNLTSFNTIQVDVGTWHMDTFDLDTRILTIGTNGIFDLDSGDLTIGQSIHAPLGSNLTFNGANINFSATDTDNTISGMTFIADVAFRTSSAATWTLQQDLTINGDLTIGSDVTFDLDNYDLTVTGDVWVFGTLDASSSTELWFGGNFDGTGGTISPGTSKTFFYEGLSSSTLNGLNFYDVDINKSGEITLTGGLQASRNLSLTQGTLVVGSNTLTVSNNLDVDSTLDSSHANSIVSIGRNFDLLGGSLVSGDGITNFFGANASTILDSGNEFGGITVDKNSSATTVLMESLLSMSGDLLVEEGIFNTTEDVTFNGNMTISSGGEYRANGPNKIVYFNSDNSVGYWNNSGGTIRLLGSVGNLLTLRSDIENSQWSFFQNGTREINFVDVKDSDASGGQTVGPSNAVDSGNNVNWFAVSATVIMQPDAAAPGMNVVVQFIGSNYQNFSVVQEDSADVIIGPMIVTNANGTEVASSGRVISTVFFVSPDATNQTFNVTVDGVQLAQSFEILTPPVGSGDFRGDTGPFILGSDVAPGQNGTRSTGGTIVLENLYLPAGETATVDVRDMIGSTAGNQGFLPAMIVVQGDVSISGTLTVAGEDGANGAGDVGGRGGFGGAGGGGGGAGGGDRATQNDGGDGFTGGGGGSCESDQGSCVEGAGGDGSGGSGGAGGANPAGDGGVAFDINVTGGTGGTGDGGDGSGGGGGTGGWFGTSGAGGADPASNGVGGEGGGGGGFNSHSGGGGFGTAGSDGTAGTGGDTYGSAQLVPLMGGSGGGGGGATGNNGAGAGGGGGALLIFSSRDLTVDGTVDISGGNGGNGTQGDAGGGSGGGLILQGSFVDIEGTLDLSGGDSFQTGKGGSGRVRVDGVAATIPGTIDGEPTEYVGPAISSIGLTSVTGTATAGATIDVFVSNGITTNTFSGAANGSGIYTIAFTAFDGVNYITVQQTSGSSKVFSSAALARIVNDTHFVWDSGGADDNATTGENWDNDISPDTIRSGRAEIATIQTTNDQITWDVGTIRELSLNGAFTGEVTLSTTLSVTEKLVVDTGTWHIGSGDLTALNVIVGDGASFDFGSGDLTIGQSLSLSNSSPLTGSGGTTFLLANDTDNTVSGHTLVSDVVITTDGAGTWTLLRDMTIDGNLTVQAGATLDLDTFNLTVTGSVHVAGVLDASSTNELWIGRSFEVNGAGIFSGVTTQIFFFGSLGAVVDTNDTDLYQVFVQKSGTATLTNNLSIETNLSITSGTLAVSSFDLTVTNNLEIQGNLDGTNAVSDIFVAGDWNSTNGMFLSGSGKVWFFGIAAQQVTLQNEAFYVLEVINDSAGGITFIDELSAADFIAVQPNTSLTFAHNLTHTISRNLTLTGAANSNWIQINSINNTDRFYFDLGREMTTSFVVVRNSNVSSFNAVGQTNANGGNNDDGEPAPHWIFGRRPSSFFDLGSAF